MDSKPVKIGYARISETRENGKEQYVAFKELSYWNENEIQELKEKIQEGTFELFCACSPRNDIPLSITTKNVIRVKNNLQQDRHRESCPKSIRYAAWLKESKTGTEIAGDSGKIFFQVTLPGVNSGSSSSSSSSSSTTSEAQPKMKLYTMAKTLNCIAWEKQTYSLKKEIGVARREGRLPILTYKNVKAFAQLVYGISHDIYIQSRNRTYALAELYYNTKAFYECMDYKKRFFVYAQLERVSTYKPERVYQYITLKMPSKNSPFKTAVRMKTEKFKKMFDTANIPDPDESNIMVAGWINHSIFPLEDGSANEWATLLQGAMFEVSDEGLIIENNFEKELVELLCKENIIFRKPYQPIENYGGVIPSLLIEVRNKKNIIIDIVDEKTYSKREEWGISNEEFYCILLKDVHEPKEIIEKVKEYMKSS